MNRLMVVTLVAMLTAMASASADAQAFPVKPVRLVVAFAPGGAAAARSPA